MFKFIIDIFCEDTPAGLSGCSSKDAASLKTKLKEIQEKNEYAAERLYRSASDLPCTLCSV